MAADDRPVEDRPVEDSAFRAMGSDAHVIVVGGPPGGAERARARIDDLEARWSRFRPDSEISGLTRRAGEWVTLSPESRLLVERAVEAWRVTVGRFDPTVLGAVIRAGYDRSFELLDRDGGTGDPDGGASPLTAGAAGIEIDGMRVRLPAGVGFDPGGIGKGLAADLVVAGALAAGAAGACVNLGGDLRVAGVPPAGPSWTIAVEHPASPAPVALLGLHEGAVATSTTLRRRWTAGGEQRHHLIDPWTGAPSTSDLTLAAVVAAEGWAAEVLAKAVLLRGSAAAFDLVAGLGADALTVDRHGLIRATPGLAAFLGGTPLPLRLPEA